MRGALLAVALLGACKGKPAGKADEQKPVPRDAASPTFEVDWKACDAALERARTAPLDDRPRIVIDGCRVCGDWTPILDWNRPHDEGGPTRLAIEQAMLACHAYCDANAKQRFLGALDDARGLTVRTPWRQLAQVCKDQVSAGTDARFIGAPYFALDRIARAAAAHGGKTASALAALELPLPPLSVSGAGVVLPDLSDSVTSKVDALQITLLGNAIHVGRMPRARLGANGVTVDLGPDGYPGKQVEAGSLGAALAALVGDDHTSPITLLAPHAMPAQGLVPVIETASKLAPVYLAANAPGAPVGWDQAGTVPVALEGGGPGAIEVTGTTTVQQLADELARRAAAHQQHVGIVAR